MTRDSKKVFNNFTIEQLQGIKSQIEGSSSKEELAQTLDAIIKEKESFEKSRNSSFLVSWLTIGPSDIQLLHDNGIHNLAQLQATDIWSLEGMTEEQAKRINWAKNFFDMDNIEQYSSEQDKSLNTKFLVSWLTVDAEDIRMLYQNNIVNLAQLRAANLHTMKGMTEGAYERLLWAREFFNMDAPDEFSLSKRPRNKAKVASKKHVENK